MAEQTGRLHVQMTLDGDAAVQSRIQNVGRTIGLFNSLIVQASITTFVFSIIQRGVRHGAERLRDAQERLNEEVAKSGRFSKDAKERYRELKIAQEDYNMALIQQNIQYITLAGSMIVMITNTARLLGQLGALTAAYTALGVARRWAWGIIGLAVGAIGGIAIGALYMGSRGGGGEPDFEGYGRQFSRRLKQEYRRQRTTGG